MKIELHKQFKVPIDGLIPIAEEITIHKEKRAALDNKPFVKVEAAATSPEAEEKEDEEVVPELSDRKAHKKMMKSMQKEKRQLKKQLK